MTAIVFDLDGTLIDSLPDIHAALNKVLAGEGAAPVTAEEAKGFIGHGIPNLVAQARHARGIDIARQHAMTDEMFRHYLAHPADLTRPYPGVVEALTALRDMGHPLGICTNKALKPTRDILQALNLGSFFAEVVGGDSLPQKKPDPSPLHACFAALGAPLLYVGDSEVDAETALRAGIPFALYTQGYRKAPVAELAHDLAFDDFARLVDWVKTRG